MSNTTPTVLHQAHPTHHQLTLNRPERGNALNIETLHKLETLLHLIQHAEPTLPIVLQGHGKHLCTGMDLHEATVSPDHLIQLLQSLDHVLATLHQLPNPICVLAKGQVLGGGLGLVACADQVFGQVDCRLGCPEIQLGIAPAVIAPYVIDVIGHKWARQLFLSGTPIDCKTAQQLGLVHRTYDQPAEIQSILDKMLLQWANAPIRSIHKIHDLTSKPIIKNSLDFEYFRAQWPELKSRFHNKQR